VSMNKRSHLPERNIEKGNHLGGKEDSSEYYEWFEKPNGV